LNEKGLIQRLTHAVLSKAPLALNTELWIYVYKCLCC